jgi:hypothetical protein
MMGSVVSWVTVLVVSLSALGCEVNADSDSESGGSGGTGDGSGTAGENGAAGESAAGGGAAGESAAGGGAGGESGAGAGAAGENDAAGQGGAPDSGGTGGTAPDAVDEILSDPAVQSALDEASAQGVEVATHVEKTPPDPTGYYSFAFGNGTWVASGNGANVGFSTTASEMRVELQSDGSVDTASVSSFDGVAPSAYVKDKGYLLRGSGNDATLYGRRQIDCDLSGASYSMTQAYIWSGTFEQGTGDWIEQRQFVVTTAIEGELTSECEQALVGNTEVVGGWAVVEVPLASRVTPDELAFMCSEGGRGYVPEELWTGADGAACECTAEFLVSCEG